MLVFVIMVVMVLLAWRMVAAAHLTPGLLHKLLLQRRGVLLHDLQELGAVDLVFRRRDDGRLRVESPDLFHSLLHFGIIRNVCTAQDDSSSRLHLVSIELAKVLQVHFAFLYIHHCGGAVQHHVRICLHALNRFLDVGELSDSGWLNEDPVRMVGVNDLFQRSAKVPHKGAADTSGIHFPDLYSGLLEEASVDADLTELVLNEHDLLSLKSLFQQLLDERRLAGSQKA